ncbi:hypothetical protein [Acinetobacter bereziniae]|uniref:hypothetical protein n=1 Tax=Acinetobacter bereziniae TaxID=106648 RepID=UPI00300BBCC6
MSKTVRWIIFTIIVLVICDWIIISYWRDNNEIEVSSTILINMLIGFPLAIVFGVFAITRLFAFAKRKPDAPIVSEITEESPPSTEDEIKIKHIGKKISVLATAVSTPFGEDLTQIMTALNDKKLPEPDPLLKFQISYPYLSRRIESLILLNDQENSASYARPLFTDRAKRVEQMTSHLLKQLALVLQSIQIKNLNFNQEERDKAKNQQARLHPEWVSQTKKTVSEELPTVYRPHPSLKIVYILPSHISEVERNTLFDLFKHYLNLMGIHEQHDVDYFMTHVESNEATQRIIHNAVMEHLEIDHVSNPQLLLIMGADSWIDQIHLDVKFNQQQKAAQPSEGGFAVLFSDQQSATDIEPIADITIPLMYKSHQSAETLNLIQAIEQLQQAYNFQKNDKVLGDDEIVFTDHAVTHTKFLADLMSVSDHFQIEEDQFVTISPILNDTVAMVSGLSLSLALENSAENKKNTLLIHNAESQFGYCWMVTSPKHSMDGATSQGEST